MIGTIDRVKKTYNSTLEIQGIVLTMYDSRNNLAVEVSEQLLSHFGERVYETVVPRNVKLAEAPSYGRPIIYYAPSSRGAYAYVDLAAEILERAEKEKRDEGNAL